ncbi:hypothetical protein F4801DRAFT_325715 [Xylaria longipes]|nr:hypothetical protein F4801DRAFT_325715 [Xylaria longipes]
MRNLIESGRSTQYMREAYLNHVFGLDGKYMPKFFARQWFNSDVGYLFCSLSGEMKGEEGWAIRLADLVLRTEVTSATLLVSLMTVKDAVVYHA